MEEKPEDANVLVVVYSMRNRIELKYKYMRKENWEIVGRGS